MTPDEVAKVALRAGQWMRRALTAEARVAQLEAALRQAGARVPDVRTEETDRAA